MLLHEKVMPELREVLRVPKGALDGDDAALVTLQPMEIRTWKVRYARSH